MSIRLVIDGVPASEDNSSHPSTNPSSNNSSNDAPQHNASKTVIEPTFLLRGVDVANVVKQYLNGGFDDVDVPTTKVNSAVRGVVADYSVGRDARSEIYEYVDRSGRRQRVVTINHDNYNKIRSRLNGCSYKEIIENKTEQNSDLPAGGICLWCRRKFNFNPVGMPVRIEYMESENITVYHTIGSYCTFECCYSDLKYKTKCPFSYRDPRYMDSESMLRRMFERSHPDEKLTEQNDWVLGQWNGGPLSEEDFFSKSHSYQRGLNMVLLPAKYEYTMQTKSNGN